MNITCPACNSTDLETLIDLGHQPLSLMDLSPFPATSKTSPTYSTRMLICRQCFHVHNVDFNPDFEYHSDGCRMWNEGEDWAQHVDRVRAEAEKMALSANTVMEIGAGDGAFLYSIRCGDDVDKIAIDPATPLKLASERFTVINHLFKPDMIWQNDGNLVVIMRHLLEHMQHPRQFIEDIVSRQQQVNPDSTLCLLIEVPCCEEALHRTRVEDWTYEHVQHFTLESMRAMLRGLGSFSFGVSKSYGKEVLVASVYISAPHRKEFDVDQVINSYKTLALRTGKTGNWFLENLEDIALWGGAGKSALFINQFGFPVGTRVVDSDENKWGMCVPGTGIIMSRPESLKNLPVKYIIATTAWRAEDIANEINKHGIECEKLFKVENGNLMELKLG